MSEIKLLPCPFCGGEAKLEINREMGGTQYQVLCTKCPTTVGRYWFWKKEDAINLWNTRKPIQEIVERLEKEKVGKMFVAGRSNGKTLQTGINYGIATAIEIVKGEGGMNEQD